ncbi:MAG: serine hydrolase [Acetivibrio ethanolgignens]
MNIWRKKIGAFIIMVLLISCIFFEGRVSSAASNMEEIKEPDNLYALSACLMDADTGRILFEKNGEEERAMASTTKIMTLLVALEHGNLEDEVKISENAARQPDVQLNVCTGEKYKLEDLLYSLMLESHNDAAVAIAEHVGGSAEGFANLMNQKAKELTLSHTHFVTPNGLDGEDDGGKHRTTAVELARLLSYCITESAQKEKFLEITQKSSHSFSDLEGKRQFTCNNHNAFLNMMEGALTGKTGFTGEAGYCYVGALRRDGKTFVVSLLGCGWPNNKGYKWKDTKKLMEYGIANYEKKSLEKLPQKGEVLKVVPVVDGEPKCYGEEAKVALVLEKPFLDGSMEGRNSLLLRKDEQLVVKTELPASLTAPLEEHAVVGKVSYFINEEKLGESNVMAQNTVPKVTFHWYFFQLLKEFFL